MMKRGKTLCASVLLVLLVSTLTGCFLLGSASLRVINEYSSAITTINIASVSSGGWGSNWLDSPLATGSSILLTGILPGTYNLRAVAANGAQTTAAAVIFVDGDEIEWTLYTTKGDLTGEAKVSAAKSGFLSWVANLF